MDDKYRRTRTTVSLLNYHIVFCPKYRRKIFLVPGVEQRFKELAREALAEHGVEVLALECHVDHVHAFVSALPDQAPKDVVRWMKGRASREIRAEFPELSAMNTLWTRSYFVSTAGSVSAETVRRYVETQKTRPYTKKERERMAGGTR